MSTRFVFCFICLIVFQQVSAQNLKNRQSLSIDPGVSFPFGDYGDKQVKNNASGFADIGGVTTISYSYQLKQKFGLTVSLLAQFNPMSRKKMESEFSSTQITSPIAFSSTGPGQTPLPPAQGSGIIYPNWKFETKSWFIGSVLFGGFGNFSFKQNKQLSLQPRLMIGPGIVLSPAIKGSSKTDTSSASFTQTKAKSFAIVGEVGIGINYNLNSRYFIRGNLDVLTTNELRLKTITATINTAHGTSVGSPGYSISSSSITGIGRQTVSTLNAGVGIGIRF